MKYSRNFILNNIINENDIGVSFKVVLILCFRYIFVYKE